MRSSFLLIALSALAFLATPASAAEICGNGIDDDSDGSADETCWPAGANKICENPVGCGVTGDIAPKTGGIVYRLKADIDPKVAYGPSIPFIRQYHSLYEPGGSAPQYRTSAGARWQHNWQSWIDKSGTTAVVHLTTGQDVLFTYTGTLAGFDYYAPQPGYHFKHLRQATASPNKWELRTLTGDTFTYDWASPVGKLIEVGDSVGNKVTVAYDGSGRPSIILDASGTKRLVLTYTNGRVDQVRFHTIDGGTPTTRYYVTFAYSGANQTLVKARAVTTLESHSYDANNYLTLIEDGGGNDILDVSWVSGSSGKTARVLTGEGGIGFDYASSHAQCTGGTILFFNLANTTSCDTDSNCGGALRCGGKTGTGSTGRCYRAARCLQTTGTHSEDLIGTVTALTPCTGACAPTAEYAYFSNTDLKGIKLADGNWTSFERDTNGMILTMAEGDTDNDATNTGGLKTFFTYDTTNPGRMTDLRYHSTIKEGTFPCTASDTSGCKRTQHSWNSTTGLLDSTTESGFTYNASEAITSFSYTTAFVHDSVGRRTQITGPLSGVDDNIEFTFHSSTDVLKNGYPNEVKRKIDTSNYLTTIYDDYDYFGNAKSQKDPDLTFTCRTFDGDRNVLTQVREAMNGQTSCGTTHASDLTTDFVRDSWLRLTKTTRPLGDCQHKEYDSSGRLTHTKLRDDCVAGNSGDTMQQTYETSGQFLKGEFKDASGTVTFRTEGSYHDGLQLSTRINPVSPTYSTSFTYASDAQNDEITFENGLGKIKQIFDAQNRETSRRRYTAGIFYDNWTFSYPSSPARKIETVTDFTAATTTNYDDLGRKTRIVSPDSGTTLFVFDAASRITSMAEAYGLSGQVTHSYTYDYLGRKLTEDYGSEHCPPAGTNVTEVQYTWDASPGSCPTGATCGNQKGRLAYVKTVLLCDATYGDLTLDQETFYGFDPSGRMVSEHAKDDTGRAANHLFSWDKNGNLTQATAPSGVAMGFTMGGSGNSDANLATTLWRNNGSTTNLATSITWAPFSGPVTQYDHANTISGGVIRAMLTWNLAYRATQIKYRYTATGADRTKIDYTEDVKGRYTLKAYSNVTSGMQSNYLKYDQLDRITCDAAVSGTCPTSGTNLKTNVLTYTGSNDRVTFKHQDLYSGDYQYNLTQSSGSDKVASFTQTGVSGSTTLGWDTRGNRTYEDESTSSFDRRDFTYDGRRRVRTVSGKIYVINVWHNYVITNTYDHRDRRVSRHFHDTTSGLKSQWFYYYDVEDRLIEIKYTPNLTDTSTYSMYQFYWLRNRLVSYFGTSYPAATTARYFVHSDEANRPLEVMDWPSSGDASVVWAVNPDAFGWDRVLTGSIFQPFRLNGAYFEDATFARKDATTVHRSGILTERGVVFDPMLERFMARVGAWPNEAYVLEDHNPAVGLRTVTPPSVEGAQSQRSRDMMRSRTCGVDSWRDPVGNEPADTVVALDDRTPSQNAVMNTCFADCICGRPCLVLLTCCDCPRIKFGPGFSRCVPPPPSTWPTCSSYGPAFCILGAPFPGPNPVIF